MALFEPIKRTPSCTQRTEELAKELQTSRQQLATLLTAIFALIETDLDAYNQARIAGFTDSALGLEKMRTHWNRARRKLQWLVKAGFEKDVRSFMKSRGLTRKILVNR